MKKLPAMLLGVACLFLGPAYGQSFHCPQYSCPESVICDTPMLSRLDDTMAGLYYQIRGMASKPAAGILLRNQRAWLDLRNSCGCNATCLESAYAKRIDAFRNVIGSE